MTVKKAETITKEKFVRLERRPETGFLCFIREKDSPYIERVFTHQGDLNYPQSPLGFEMFLSESDAEQAAHNQLKQRIGDFVVSVVRVIV